MDNHRLLCNRNDLVLECSNDNVIFKYVSFGNGYLNRLLGCNVGCGKRRSHRCSDLGNNHRLLNGRNNLVLKCSNNDIVLEDISLGNGYLNRLLGCNGHICERHRGRRRSCSLNRLGRNRNLRNVILKHSCRLGALEYCRLSIRNVDRLLLSCRGTSEGIAGRSACSNDRLCSADGNNGGIVLECRCNNGILKYSRIDLNYAVVICRGINCNRNILICGCGSNICKGRVFGSLGIVNGFDRFCGNMAVLKNGITNILIYVRMLGRLFLRLDEGRVLRLREIRRRSLDGGRGLLLFGRIQVTGGNRSCLG